MDDLLDHRAISERLGKLCKRGLGLKQYEFAKMIGANTAQVNNWMRGFPIPASYVARIAQVFSVDPQWLWFGRQAGMPLGLLRAMGELPSGPEGASNSDRA